MDYNKVFKLLRSYFASGWAFLIPYVIAFLIYYKFKLPLTNSGPHQLVPTLLHIYWCIHCINLGLAFIAIYSLRHGPTSKIPTYSIQLLSVAPWALLALTFYIPGTYLEFPSDPWEHLAHITHWADSNTLQTLYKSFGYSIPYSFLGTNSRYARFIRLDLYTTGICLILCWQYFRLGVAVGLSNKFSLLFVLIQSVTFGNSTFSFYKYYSLASTIYSQIAAIALIRLFIELIYKETAESQTYKHKGLANKWHLFKFLLCAIFLIIVIVLNHMQGLGIAGLGLLAVGIWSLMKHNRSLLICLLIGTIALNVATVFWFPRSPLVDQLFKPGGLINTWYGFNLFSIHSIAAEKMIQILGFFGILNLAAALILIYHNKVAGWLSIIPIIALELPCIAQPFVKALTLHNDKNTAWAAISVFCRMFLVIPSGLAIVCLIFYFKQKISKLSFLFKTYPSIINQRLILIVILSLYTILPPSSKYYNRLWNSFAIIPNDLSKRNIIKDIDNYTFEHSILKNNLCITTSGLGYVFYSISNIKMSLIDRTFDGYGNTLPGDIAYLHATIPSLTKDYNITLANIHWNNQYSHNSFASLASNHWLPQEGNFTFLDFLEMKKFNELFNIIKVNNSLDFYIKN
jgi:hypothetical protein